LAEDDVEDYEEEDGQLSVKIRYEPWREIIIKELVYFQNPSDLAEIVAGFRVQGVLMSLNWRMASCSSIMKCFQIPTQ
jgi:hypothetical protein